MFAPPQWLQDLGLLAWFLVGLGLVLLALSSEGTTVALIMLVVGLVLGAPIASAAVHISRDLALARAKAPAEPSWEAPSVPASAGG